jgi:effector-binding domain-containing protein
MNGSGTNTVAQRPLDGVEEITLAPRVVVGLRETVAVNELSAFFTHAIPAVAAELARVGTRPAGAPVAVYRHEHGQQFDVTVGFPVDEAPESTEALVREELPGGRAARAVHAGPYETLSETYSGLGRWFAERKLTPPEVMWEEYLVGPESGDELAYRTRVVYPVR